VVSEATLKAIVKEWKSTGPVYRSRVQTRIRGSYRSHYRRMLAPPPISPARSPPLWDTVDWDQTFLPTILNLADRRRSPSLIKR
jgi:hypothetical protein